MEFFLRAQSTGPSFDVGVDAEPSHTVEDLTDALAKFFGLASSVGLVAYRANGEALLPFTTIAEAGIISGETIHVVGEDVPFQPEPDVLTGEQIFIITAGPDSGNSLHMRPGNFTISRSELADLTLTDPHVSAVASNHLQLQVNAKHVVTITPAPGLTNEVRLNGTPLTQSAQLTENDVVRIGTTSGRLRTIAQVTNTTRDVFGQVPFHRTPYFPAPVEPVDVKPLGSVPTKPEPNRFTYMMAIAPIFMGIMFWYLGRDPRYMLFILMSPIIAVGNFFDQRKRQGNKFKADVERFRKDLAERVSDIHGKIWQERIRKFGESPDVADLASRSNNRSIDLWIRDREAYDYLTVRIGTGDIATKVQVKPESSGDQNFLDEMDALVGDTETHRDVPVSISLSELGVVALIGPDRETTGLAASVAAQAACLHSPEDLIIFSSSHSARQLNEWLKWAPHCRSASSPIGSEHLVSTKAETDALMRDLAAVAAARLASDRRDQSAKFPWLLFFLDKVSDPDPAVLSRLLDVCPDAGITVVWMTDSPDRVPRQAQASVTCQPLVTGQMSEIAFTDPTRPNQPVHLEQLEPANAAEIGRSLAPLRDASSVNAATAIPKIVPLFTSFGVEDVTPNWVIDQWSIDRGYSLQGPVGMTETGQMVLDLVEQGPHALIGGTSGAGKSELLMSLVAGMISYNPPSRINFLFIDYKGGASSDLFKDVPHTVGYVTNLDGLLSLRALTSLGAELDRRMDLMQGKAKDIAEMIEKFPDQAPPSLVIVIDEFATLVKEIPDFIAGMVDIAQRGRSLGIHLILATQRPSGAINENIKANTNLRISLRMLDSSESQAVIGTNDAANIPGPLKGRGFARVGPGELLAFQSAWSGAPKARASGPAPVTVSSFTTLHVPKISVQSGEPEQTSTDKEATEDGDEITHIDTVLDAVAEASRQLGYERGRTPWKDELPKVIPLLKLLENDRLVGAREPGRDVVIGMTDSPETQDQYPSVLDLESGGGLTVFGTGGSGKTTFLQTVAASAAADDHAAGGGELTIFGLDFASRELAILNRLPQCGGIGLSDNFETVTRIVASLEVELERRRSLLSEAAERAEAKPSFSRILFLIDSYENLTAALEGGPTARLFNGWTDKINNIIVEGRQVGIHSVIATARRNGIRSNVMSAISNRLFLRQTDPNTYAEVGIRSADVQDLELNPGQGFLNTSNIFQAAVLADQNKTSETAEDASAPGQPEHVHPLVDFADELAGHVDPRLDTKALASVIPVPAHGASETKPVVGLADMTNADYVLDLTYNNVTVFGDPRSGRSTTLAAIAHQVTSGGGSVWAVGSEGSPLAKLNCFERTSFGDEEAISELLQDLATVIAEGERKSAPMLIFDDVDMFEGRKIDKAIEGVIKNTRWAGSVTSFRGYSSNPLISEMKKARTFVVLRPTDPRTVQEMTNSAPNWRPGLPMPPGRGAVVADRMTTYVQFFDGFSTATDTSAAEVVKAV